MSAEHSGSTPSRVGIAAAVILTAAANSFAQSPSPVHLLDVPYLEQSEALCGGAAAAMVMRYWGATGVYAESFAGLVDREAGGIRGEDLLGDLRRRGWEAHAFRGDRTLVTARLAARQPVVALIEDRPGAFHFVVVVGWTNGRVVYHDPARAPFRVVGETTFESAWEKSGRWTLLTLPPADGVRRNSEVPSSDTGSTRRSPCDALVEAGVAAAHGGDHRHALSVLGSAADLCPSASAPLREMAGVHVIDGQWTDAERLARAAVTRDRADAHAWRILATAAYVRGDPAAALEAWNAAGEPIVDLVTVQGLDRTRHAAVTRLLDIAPGSRLTAPALAAAGKRLDELPSADAARVSYKPLGNGRASVEAIVVERPRLPTSRGSLVSVGLRALTERELSFQASSLSGGGEVVSAGWRFWEDRPRVEIAYATPTALGVLRADVFGEKQTYVTPGGSLSESRRGGGLSLANWTPSLLRWQIGLSLDSWQGDRRTVGGNVALDQRLASDRVALRASAFALAGSGTAAGGHAEAEWKSRVRNEGTVFVARAGADAVSATAPLALWAGAGTGHARAALLRAHPLLEDGRITGGVFGRRLHYGSVESRYWRRPVFRVIRIAPAVFVDAARAHRRVTPGRSWHVDAGIGLRVAVPGSALLRVDVAKGFRDGNTALSIGWTR